jgi:hypothetical protein
MNNQLLVETDIDLNTKRHCELVFDQFEEKLQPAESFSSETPQ